jgi:hypothetical protein
VLKVPLTGGSIGAVRARRSNSGDTIPSLGQAPRV